MALLAVIGTTLIKVYNIVLWLYRWSADSIYSEVVLTQLSAGACKMIGFQNIV